MKNKLFTKAQLNIFKEAIKTREKSINSYSVDKYATPKSALTILEDLYGSIISFLDDPQTHFIACSCGWEMKLVRESIADKESFTLEITEYEGPESYKVKKRVS